MMLVRGRRWWVIWSWPRDQMAWWFWNDRSCVFPDTRSWRIGPLDLTIVDEIQTTPRENLEAAAEWLREKDAR